MANDNLKANSYKLAGIIQQLVDTKHPMAEKTVTGNRVRKAITVKGTRRRIAPFTKTQAEANMLRK